MSKVGSSGKTALATAYEVKLAVSRLTIWLKILYVVVMANWLGDLVTGLEVSDWWDSTTHEGFMSAEFEHELAVMSTTVFPFLLALASPFLARRMGKAWEKKNGPGDG